MSALAAKIPTTDWERVRLGEILTLNYGKALPKSERNPSGPIPVYGANGIKDCADHAVSAEPTLIIGRKGSAGQITRVEGPFWPLDVTYFTSHDQRRIDFDYLAYALSMLDLPSLARGVKPGINRNDVYALEILMPSTLDEQKRIVAVLDQALAALDRARAHIEANNKNSGFLFESWLKSEFNRGEQSWPLKPLSEIAENLDRKRVPIKKKDRDAGNVPYYGASGVVDYVADYIFDEDLLLISEDGANLLARAYPIAFSISGKSWVNNHAHVLRFDDLDSQEFVRLYLNSISIASFVSGMAQPKLNQNAVGRIQIPYPPLEERKRVVAAAAAIWQHKQEANKIYEQQFLDVGKLRESLLQQAFAGQLT